MAGGPRARAGRRPDLQRRRLAAQAAQPARDRPRREAGHHTHGDGTAVDLVPAVAATQDDWDRTAGRLAASSAGRRAAAASGARPACALKPAIQWVGYDGYPSHGSPRTCTGECPAHIHVSWVSACYGSSALVAPCAWVHGVPGAGERRRDRSRSRAAGEHRPVASQHRLRRLGRVRIHAEFRHVPLRHLTGPGRAGAQDRGRRGADGGSVRQLPVAMYPPPP